MGRGKTLRSYRAKRNFRASPEPKGGRRRGTGRGGPLFVVQEHDASTHHYDLRLEVSGVLKSWAVPKGPSTDPRERRLALVTEDHPLEYADFEGRIPAGEYGAGTVIVWDTGTYRNLKRDGEGNEVPMEKALEGGQVEVRLEGKKLRGGYALVRTDRGKGERWLLIKMKDEEADARRKPTSTERESVRSGRTLEEVAKEGGEETGG